MGIEEDIEQTTGYEKVAQSTEQTQQQRQELPANAQTYISLEQGDVEFWLNVGQLILLYLILQELQG